MICCEMLYFPFSRKLCEHLEYKKNWDLEHFFPNESQVRIQPHECSELMQVSSEMTMLASLPRHSV